MRSAEQYLATFNQSIRSDSTFALTLANSGNSPHIPVPENLQKLSDDGFDLLLMHERSKFASTKARFEGAVTGDLATLIVWSKAHPELRWAIATGKDIYILEVAGECGTTSLSEILAKANSYESEYRNWQSIIWHDKHNTLVLFRCPAGLGPVPLHSLRRSFAVRLHMAGNTYDNQTADNVMRNAMEKGVDHAA